ncbi:hypothetical protein BSKO_03830 [Bryopsis sp. KO-2023]|nr:hypothetical protein BSKO_03830 [Bryopsis sp. KO-2023]
MNLEGYIFTCNVDTFKECVDRKLFGLPSGRQSEVSRIAPCTPLFLFNCTTKELICGFEADGYGKLNVSPSAFDGRFPAQVKIKILQPGLPKLCAEQYGPVVFEDLQRRRLRHALNGTQVARLLQLAAMAPRTQPACPVRMQERPRNARGGGRKWYGHHRVLTSGPTPVAKRPRLVEPRPTFREAPPTGCNVDPLAAATRLPVVSNCPVTRVEGGVEPTRDLAALGNEQERSAQPTVTFGEEIDENLLKLNSAGSKPQTTVLVHPLPPCMQCPLPSLVDMLDLVCKGRYGFLLVETVESIGRVLYVDFVSESDVAKFRAEFGGKSWKKLLRNSGAWDGVVKMYFWKECQGLKELTKTFRELHYLHVGEPYMCPKLVDDWPLFFLSNVGQGRNPRTDIDSSGKQTTKQCSSLCEGMVNRFDYQELLDKVKEGCGGEVGSVAKKFKEEVVARARKDLLELADAKAVVRNRFDVEEFRSNPEYELFKEAGALVLEVDAAAKSDVAVEDFDFVDLEADDVVGGDDADDDGGGISEVDIMG